MVNRAADSTIKGFLYQFNASILEILKNPNTTFVAEGLEDLDRYDKSGISEAIQYKFYKSQKATPSVLREAIIPMIEDFKKRKDNSDTLITYKIFGYFKDFDQVTIDEGYLDSVLIKGGKEAINFKEKLGLSNQLITDFTNYISIEESSDFNEFQSEVIQKITDVLPCNKVDAELFYYPRALNFINKKSIHKNIDDRKITHEELLQYVDKKTTLFSSWLSELKGKNLYLSEIRKNLNLSKRVLDYHQRFFIISCEGLSNRKIEHLITTISDSFYKRESTSIRSPAPHILLLGLQQSEIISAKNAISDIGYKLVDGYPFLGSHFRASHLTVKCDLKNEISIKFIDTIENLNTVFNHYATEIKKVFVFSKFDKSEQIAKKIELSTVNVELASMDDAVILLSGNL